MKKTNQFVPSFKESEAFRRLMLTQHGIGISEHEVRRMNNHYNRLVEQEKNKKED